MKIFVHGDNLCAIIIATHGERLRLSAPILLERLGIEFIVCDDIYQAAGELLSDDQKRRLFVIGGLYELCRDQMRFIELCAQHRDVKCFAVTGKNIPARYSFITHILNNQGTVTDSERELDEAICEFINTDTYIQPVRAKALLTDKPSLPSARPKDSDTVLSDAELDALLGAA